MQKPTETALNLLIYGCCRSNRQSQLELYKQFYAYGMSICIRYVVNESEAQAILNDGFLKVFLNIKRFDKNQPFKPWLRQILINTALNHIKKQKKFKMEVAMEEAKHLTSPEEILSRFGYQEIISMVQSLSTAYRTVFNLYVIDGFKHEEIADKLGITVSTSKANLTRARAKLKEIVTQKLKLA